MNTSILYHAFGICDQECSRVRYEDKSVVFEVQTRFKKLRCPCCKSLHFIRSGSTIGRFRGVPIGPKPVFSEMKVQGLECKDCHCIRQENIHFITGKRSYTNRLAHLIVELSRLGTIKDVAHFLHLSWDTVKYVRKRYLQVPYGCPNLNELEYIGIDEFAVAKGHVYKTIVVNLPTGQVVYIGDGKGAISLYVNN